MRESILEKQGLYDPDFEHSSCGVGFIADLQGRATHEIVRRGIEIVDRMNHRGAVGSDPKTGDGAGILIQIPHEFFQAEWASGACGAVGKDTALPEPGKYAVGMVFLPQSPTDRQFAEGVIEQTCEEEGLVFLGWRVVPTNNGGIGQIAIDMEPRIRQIFVKPTDDCDQGEFEIRLFRARLRVPRRIKAERPSAYTHYYMCSLSTRTLVYKGMLLSPQLCEYFPDLLDPLVKSALAVVHSRYSTNTYPTWDLAHPFRMLAHNGEINTLSGNMNWLRTRERLISGGKVSDRIKDVLPLGRLNPSDSELLDNCLEFIVLGGRSLAHAIMMMIPEAWEKNATMDPEKRAFYDFHSSIIEPWDGPATVVFTDGRQVGTLLDRNGLRPARYMVTRDGLVILASETGVVDIPEKDIIERGRLEPGRMLLVDLEQKRIIPDKEIVQMVAGNKPYAEWLKNNKIKLSQLASPPPMRELGQVELRRLHNLFGYSVEDLRVTFESMVADSKEPIGAMGMDIPPSCLSRRPQLLYTYFKQRFAQVTNPPIDPIREKVVMSTTLSLGGEEGDMLQETPGQCHQIELPHPILDNEQIEQIRHYSMQHFRSVTLPMLYNVHEGAKGLEAALEKICDRARDAIRAGHSLIILSDKTTDIFMAPIPALLAASRLHHFLIDEGIRTRAGIIVESGEPRESHHFCLLIGFGVTAINPYVAFDTIKEIIGAEEKFVNTSIEVAKARYVEAATSGMLKILSKMGISTLSSYHGAKIFEAIGVSSSVIARYFPGTPSRIEGIDLEVIADEVRRRHEWAFPKHVPMNPLRQSGTFKWRKNGELHLLSPDVVGTLQTAAKLGDYRIFKQYSKFVNDSSSGFKTLRAMLDFNTSHVSPIPIDQVEPVESIMKRFTTGAMSFGSISWEAHTTLARAMNLIGGRSNTGEGGETPERLHQPKSGDSMRSAIKQVASGRFGVTTEYLVNADELQIKVAQGAKPGEGGQLPGDKVNGIIAKTRFSTPGVGLISPPPHHDIYSIEDLAQLIFDLHNVNPEASISVKLVSQVGVGTVAAGVAKAKADLIVISGDSGGTGASPLSSIENAGVPWELGLAEAHQTLILNDLRSRVRLQVDGKLMTGRDVIVGALLGAEEFGFATMPLVTVGCTMLRQCHENNCAFGVATQDERLRGNFKGKVEYVVNFFRFIAEETREIMASLGARKLDDLVGRSELLRSVNTDDFKAKRLDFSNVLFKPVVTRSIGTRCLTRPVFDESDILDKKFLDDADRVIKDGSSMSGSLPICNVNRTVGGMISGRVAKAFGHKGLKDNSINLEFTGTAGQSFGAWGAHGLTLTLIGAANDYVGKGLSGARVAIRPSPESTLEPENNIIAGNVCLYGAIDGKLFINGRAGARFCVRNSGATTVVEGIGDHGCEYMTGGVALILGTTGWNFAAGMSGGMAFIRGDRDEVTRRTNVGSVLIEEPTADDLVLIKGLMDEHLQMTGSPLARRLLDDWRVTAGGFVKIMPIDLKRVLAQNAAEVKAVS